MTGFIGVGQLRYILTNLGEKMSDDEVDELLKAVDTSSGEINYTGEPGFGDFVHTDVDFASRSRPDDPRKLRSSFSQLRIGAKGKNRKSHTSQHQLCTILAWLGRNG